jgi:hypothetical protein
MLQAICSSSSREVFFPLYVVLMFENQRMFKNIDFYLGVTECQINHTALIGSKSQTELDHLHYATD